MKLARFCTQMSVQHNARKQTTTVCNTIKHITYYCNTKYRLESSVRPILCIGEYSLVALQYRRIRYIGLRVSADTDAPAAITINSNLTRRLKHGLRRQNVTTNEAGISIHVPPYRLQV